MKNQGVPKGWSYVILGVAVVFLSPLAPEPLSTCALAIGAFVGGIGILNMEEAAHNEQKETHYLGL